MDSSAYFAIALVTIAVAFFFIFKPSINAAIGRVKAIGKSGVAFGSPQEEAKKESDPRTEAEALMRDMDNALIREIEDKVEADLRSRNITGDHALRVLKRYYAGAAIGYQFEMTYTYIYGSQLDLLHYLNIYGAQPVQAIRPFYVSGSNNYPQLYTSYSFEDWLNFLKKMVLVLEDGGRILITVRGSEFLTYLTRVGRSLNKAG
jgi:hypothetical protein